MIGIVAHQCRQIKGDRQAGLPVLQQIVVALIGLFRRGKSGELPHGPKPSAIHLAVDSSRVWAFARSAQIARGIEIHKRGGCIDPGALVERRTARGDLLDFFSCRWLKTFAAAFEPRVRVFHRLKFSALYSRVDAMNLRWSLRYEPRELQFGTSGRRGEVIHLTDLEIYINVLAELEYLQSLPLSAGGIARGDDFYFALDLRPSSARLSHAVERAIHDAGMRPVSMGCIPTPALMYYAASNGKGSIMVTGSHIPFDRNGYKLNTSRGELLKDHEQPINQAVRRLRERIYDQSFAESIFNEHGMFKYGAGETARVCGAAGSAYVDRYVDFFGAGSLSGLRVAAYQHSAVGRDMLVDILRRLGAEVICCGRSEHFVPIDTENIGAEQLAAIQELANGAGKMDAVVSTDGDSDRPLILGVDALGVNNGQVRFFGGDLVGMIVAEFLGADAVVVPITCNDAIDRGPLASALEPKTKIGSPYVIAGMEQARAKGRRAVCGWEANGGFLTGSDIARNGRPLKALPTRDAMLPILAVLRASVESGKPLAQLFAGLPQRFSRAGLLRNYPREESRRVVERFSAAGEAARAELEKVFSRERGFGTIGRINYTDGVRIYFSNGDVAHFRPSGNADEFRIYAVADTQQRADEIVRIGVAEPDGLLRSL
jgi:phosphomannomutase